MFGSTRSGPGRWGRGWATTGHSMRSTEEGVPMENGRMSGSRGGRVCDKSGARDGGSCRVLHLQRNDGPAGLRLAVCV